jgi:hypothetical protein
MPAEPVLAQSASSSLDLGLNAGVETGLSNTDIRITIARIIRVALGLLGIIAIILTLYGGFIYMTAAGNEEKIAQAKKILLNAGVGLVIILSAFGIVSFVISSLVGAGGADGGISIDGGAGGEDDGGGGGGFSQSFYVSSLPQVGAICIRNIKLAVQFNKDVDLTTVQNNIVVQDTTSGDQPVAGSWDYSSTSTKNRIIFSPTGSCAPSVGNDCLKPTTAYKLVFVNSGNIKTLSKAPEMTLNCRLRAGCGPVDFTSGDGVDRLPPTVTINYPTTAAVLEAGASVPVAITYTDDNGVQSLDLRRKIAGNDVFVDSVSFAGCKKTDTVTINWPTRTADAGAVILESSAVDWAGLSAKDTQSATLRPSHCFNGVVDATLGEEELGPPECGGVCGACGGTTCTTSGSCASGVCSSGVCANVMKITRFSPASGAPGTFVTIVGQFFGTKPGKVFFATKDTPVVENASDWVEAGIVTCGGSTGSWGSGQIIVRVPAGIASYSHIKVESAPFLNASGAQTKNIDSTSRHIELDPFESNKVVRPNICSVSPASGKPGDTVTVRGVGFGVLSSATDAVLFGDTEATVAQNASGQSAWSDTQISVTVPAIEAGAVALSVAKNDVDSNSVRFTVEQGVDSGLPTITSVSPAVSPAGGYITLTGRNFGDRLGTVTFKTSAAAPSILGDFSFPAACRETVWTDNSIIVKFPKNAGVIGQKYTIQVTSANAETSVFDSSQAVTLASGDPSPSICAISPASAPDPFPAGQTVKIYGDYFITASAPEPKIYFSTAGASANSTSTGRVAVSSANIIQVTTNAATVVPPAGISTGPVSIYRPTDNQLSNPAQFGIFDCRSGGTCGEGTRCCSAGAQAGLCKADTELCSGEVLSAGYVWRFATKDIPPVPRVVERCDDSVSEGLALPSPAPSTQWDANQAGDSYKVCRSALATVEFTAFLDQTTVNASSIKVTRCESIDENDTCVSPTPITLTPDSFNLKAAGGSANAARHYLELQPNDRVWADDSWYQVSIGDTVASLASDGTRGPTVPEEKPCGAGTAYCFAFRSGAVDCQLKNVLVTPSSFVTQVLEAPIRFYNASGPLDPVIYRANGLSSQKCVMMDVSTVPWEWETAGIQYADIFGGRSGQTVRVESKANTVGVDVENDAVDVSANARLVTGSGSSVKTGVSPLTVDLSTPTVVDYWPKCLEACTNAEVGVRFNVSMSDRNLNGAVEKGSVQLLKCSDENCIDTTSVGNSSDISLHPESSGTVLQIANSSQTARELEPNTLYQIVISTSSTNPTTDSKVLWARAKSTDASSVGKPFNETFTWRFRTKQDRCKIDRAEVLPKSFLARTISERTVYTVQPYASPDACSAKGQKLNPWTVSWGWSSSDTAVASATSFATRGTNPACTNKCVVKGSSLPASTNVKPMPVCGNGVVEASEDCDGPSLEKRCSLDCRFMGVVGDTCGNGVVDRFEACDPKDAKTGAGCTADCRHAGSEKTTSAEAVASSICGNGLIGLGEDCDTGINASTNDSQSSAGCSARCLHTGSRLSTKWCADNRSNFAGFEASLYKTACAVAFSQCGDGVQNPDEDPGCDLGDGKSASFCNQYCLITSASKSECSAGSEGCGSNGQHLGSSLSYSAPSLCGNERVEIGEDAVCEQSLTISRTNLFDPWVLVTAIGRGVTSGQPPAQTSNIKAATNQGTAGNTVEGNAGFTLSCGYRNDVECSEAMNSKAYGVGANSCCFIKPTLLSTTPADGSTNVCRNTALEAKIDGVIDARTLPGNVLIARGVYGANATCGSGAIDVTDLMAIYTGNETSPSWYSRALAMVKRLFGQSVSAAPALPTKWCAGEIQGTAHTRQDALTTSTSYITVDLLQPLEEKTYYTIILKDGVRDTRGVSLSVKDVPLNWKFETASKICEVDSVTVTPANWFFSKSGTATTLLAEAQSLAFGTVQSIPGVYSWKFIWEPDDNPYVFVPDVAAATNTITAQNRNGELDVRAFAKVVDNTLGTATGTIANGSSHIIVSLCENPWPPRQARNNAGVWFSAFPFKDAKGNTSGFDSLAKAFNGSAIPKSSVAAVGVGDGYFNFSTHYCADNGGVGTFDDLPYLQPAVPSDTALFRSNTGNCENSGDTCQADSDCGIYYNDPGFIAPSNATSICGGTTASGGKNYFFNSTADAVRCTAVSDCTGTEFTSWTSRNSYSPTCLAVPATNKRQLSCYKYPPLKRFIFTNTVNSDAIGIQVFANPQHLTAEQWYQKDKSAGGQGFVGTLQKASISGYQAATDGSNVYVDALNYSRDSKKLESNIYLFSINQNAKQETRQVFEQLLSNLKLNTNLTYNDGYCGASMTEPEFVTRCSNDLDCSGGQVCVNQVTKLKNNYQRLRDLKQIDSLLQGYSRNNSGAYPTLATGSFLPGQSLSVWDWAGLSQALNVGIPRDPINKLGRAGTCTKSPTAYCTKDSDCSNDTCTLHDPLTGWSTADRRFSFACAPNSYAYRYTYTPTAGFTVLSNFEDVGFDPSNIRSFIDGFNFSDLSRFKGVLPDGASSGVCGSDREVTTINTGTCGDGQINLTKGEQCDPPGSKVYDRSSCTVDGAGSATVKTCSSECRLGTPSTVSCLDATKCGNGRIDTGEKCDDGVQNGKWNKCSTSCTFPPATPNPGYCGDRTVQQANEVCDGGRQVTTCSTVQDCVPQQVCVDNTTCGSKCRWNGTLTDSTCSSIMSCRGYFSNDQQVLQSWYVPSASPATVSPGSLMTKINLVSGVSGITNIQYVSANCSTVSFPYNCTVVFNYTAAANPTCNMVMNLRGEATMTLDPRTQCVGTNCLGTITQISSSGAGCVGGNTLADKDKITISLTKDTTPLSCDQDPASCVTTQSCTTQSVCTAREVCTTATVDVGQPTYAMTRNQSCSWDCQNYGPYCGDGVVQTQYGEECDGAKTCSLGAVSGSKACSASCKFVDSSSAGWWPLTTPSSSPTVFINKGSSGNGTCSGSGCPSFSSDGSKNGQGTYRFDGSDDVITIANNTALNPATTLSIEAWVKPENTRNYQRVLEKGGFAVGGGYGIELNNGNLPAFIVWGASGANDPTTKRAIDATTAVPTGVWSHIVATYEFRASAQQEILKIYINGVLNNTVTQSATVSALNTNTAPITIGRAGRGASDFFTGFMNDIRILNRVLQQNEVTDRYNNTAWPCGIPAQSSSVAVAAGTCGDGLVDAGEACDLGLGKNGDRNWCNPTTGQTCQYCSADCRVSTNATSEQFCGNGVLEGSEICETDQSTGRIYARFQDRTSTYQNLTSARGGYLVKQCAAVIQNDPNAELVESSIFKKGTKVCASDCSRITIQETGSNTCERCGIDPNGVEVRGMAVNVLLPNQATPFDDPASSNVPLLGLYGYNASPATTSPNAYRLAPVLLGSMTAPFTAVLNPNNEPKAFVFANDAGTPLRFNPDPLCSDSSSGMSYTVVMNNNGLHQPISILKQAQLWQYDLIVSPVVRQSIRPNDMRIVVSWVGPFDFNVGLAQTTATGVKTDNDTLFALKTVTGLDYYTKNFSDNSVNAWNIWYHGLGQTTNGTSVQAFTIDTSRMVAETYKLFVHSPGQSIKNFSSSARLKVDVYLPKSLNAGYENLINGNYYYPDKPTKTIYFNASDMTTTNQSASYWHAFTIKRTGATMAEKIGKASFYNAVNGQVLEFENGRIVTNAAEMQ